MAARQACLDGRDAYELYYGLAYGAQSLRDQSRTNQLLRLMVPAATVRPMNASGPSASAHGSTSTTESAPRCGSTSALVGPE